MDDSTIEQVATLLARRFICRRDVKAVQDPGGGYHPEREPWQMADLIAHLKGDRTYGHYLLNSDDTTKLFAFDADVDKEFLDDWHDGNEDLRREMHSLAVLLSAETDDMSDLTPLAAFSGNKGVHVYGLFEGPMPAGEVRAMAMLILNFTGFEPVRGDNFWKHEDFPHITVESFPKQDSLEGKDLGNLMRLPLGVHKKTGKWGMFLDITSREPKADDPVGALTGGSFRG